MTASPAPWRNALKWASAGALLIALRVFTISSTEPFQFCGFHRLTGRLCPFCGLTRALFALAKGEWNAAIHWNALSPLGFAMLLSLFWSGAYRSWLWKAGLFGFAAYGVLRIFFDRF